MLFREQNLLHPGGACFVVADVNKPSIGKENSLHDVKLPFFKCDFYNCLFQLNLRIIILYFILAA